MPTALANGAQTTTHPSGAPTRPRASPVGREILSAAPERGAPTERQGIRWDLQAIADCLKGDKRVELLQAVDSSFEKGKSRFEALREDPTLDAHRALWVDCMKETAQKFFSLHRTSKRNDAQKKLHCPPCDSNWQQKKLHAENRWESSGRHTGTWATAPNNTCTICKGSTSLSGSRSAQSAEAGKKPRGTQIDAAGGTQASLFPPSWFPTGQTRDEIPRDTDRSEWVNGRVSGRHRRSGTRIPGGHAAS